MIQIFNSAGTCLGYIKSKFMPNVGDTINIGCVSYKVISRQFFFHQTYDFSNSEYPMNEENSCIFVERIN